MPPTRYPATDVVVIALSCNTPGVACGKPEAITNLHSAPPYGASTGLAVVVEQDGSFGDVGGIVCPTCKYWVPVSLLTGIFKVEMLLMKGSPSIPWLRFNSSCFKLLVAASQ